MRPYRGIRVDNGEWVYGWGAKKGGKSYILGVTKDDSFTPPQFYFFDTEVIPETVGQLVGLKDKNGKEIHYGIDIVKFKYMKEPHEHIELIGVFDFSDEDLRAEIDIYKNSEYICLSYQGNGTMYGFEIIGTKQDNPELLEE